MSNRCSMPDIMKTEDGKERKVGVEIELSGLGYEDLVLLSSKLLGERRNLLRVTCRKLKPMWVLLLLNWIPTLSKTWIYRITGYRHRSGSWAAMQ